MKTKKIVAVTLPVVFLLYTMTDVMFGWHLTEQRLVRASLSVLIMAYLLWRTLALKDQVEALRWRVERLHDATRENTQRLDTIRDMALMETVQRWSEMPEVMDPPDKSVVESR